MQPGGGAADGDGTSPSSPPPLFSLRPPRDWRSGLASGGKSLLKGVAGGVAGAVAAPALGAATDGVKGFAMGLVAGAVGRGGWWTERGRRRGQPRPDPPPRSSAQVGLVALPVAGAGVAVAQLARGVAATPAAARARARGEVWDRGARAWVVPATSVVEAAAATAPAPPSTDLYATLGVPRTADAAAVRSAYLAAARRHHPDRGGGGDRGADFAAVADAYRVLSDPATRAKYDAGGYAAVADDAAGDAADLFRAIFGGSAAAAFVPPSGLAAGARRGAAGETAAPDDDGGVDAAVESLLARLFSFEQSGDAAALAASARADAAAVAASPFGPAVLDVVAQSYAAAADAVLNGVLGGPAARAAATARRFGARARFAGSALRAAARQMELDRVATAGGGGSGSDAAARAAAEAEALPTLLDAAWRAWKCEAQASLVATTSAALAAAPPGPARTSRAQGLRALATSLAALADAAGGDGFARAARSDPGAAKAAVEAGAAAVAHARARARDAADEEGEETGWGGR
jgi:curved DNA-binding protein CbpA